jgi:hypothetical protein
VLPVKEFGIEANRPKEFSSQVRLDPMKDEKGLGDLIRK